MDQTPLFSLPPNESTRTMPTTRPEHARTIRPNRQQLAWVARDLDAALPQDHAARAIWDLLERLDLSAFYGSIRAVIDGPGRPTTDPKVLLALWLLATSEGIGSARRLAVLCEEHDAYRWICGGVPINYHMLADFRVGQQAALDRLLTEIIGVLLHAGAVTLERVAQDGMRVRASAGAASFRRRDTLKDCRRAACEQVERLARQPEDGEVTRRQEAARARAARDRLTRVEGALARLPELEQTKDVRRRHATRETRARITEARASTSDPDARVMKMPDGGFRPAYNVQFATDGARGVVVGVAVTNTNDGGQAGPVAEQVAERTGLVPCAYLVDGGFATRGDVTALERLGTTVYAPVRAPRLRPEEARHAARYGDGPEVAAWRERMATGEAKAIYRHRGAIAEWTNARARAYGLTRFNVRGVANALNVALLVAVTHNMQRWLRLPA